MYGTALALPCGMYWSPVVALGMMAVALQLPCMKYSQFSQLDGSPGRPSPTNFCAVGPAIALALPPPSPPSSTVSMQRTDHRMRRRHARRLRRGGPQPPKSCATPPMSSSAASPPSAPPPPATHGWCCAWPASDVAACCSGARDEVTEQDLPAGSSIWSSGVVLYGPRRSYLNAAWVVVAIPHVTSPSQLEAKGRRDWAKVAAVAMHEMHWRTLEGRLGRILDGIV